MKRDFAVGSYSVDQSTRRVVVLLKHGVLEAVECERDEIFQLARIRGGGICGVFEDRSSAESYIVRHRLPREGSGGPSANKAAGL
jgi:hypothetical protein